MSNVLRTNRKADDADIIRLNACGFSLSTIGGMLKIHPTSVTERLRSLKIKPADTRRSFMEDVFLGLTTPQQEWLSNQLNQNLPVREFFIELVKEKYANITGTKE